MIRQGLFAFVLLMLCITFVAADTVKGRITKMDAKGVTVTSKKEKDGKVYTLATEVKVFKIVKKDDKEVKEPVTESIKADVFKKLSEKGINATLTTNSSGEVTEIVLAAKKKKKGT